MTSYASLIMFCLLRSTSTQITGNIGNIQDNYIGCYYDGVNDHPWLQKITLPSRTVLTVELCLIACRNSTYARLQNSEACLCGNSFGNMVPDTFCDSLCPGNQSEYCGGSNGQIDFYSLYTVCEIGTFGSRCDQVCHCRRQEPCDRMTGQCPNGCEEKWFGSTCGNSHLAERYIGCFRDNETRAISPDFHCSAKMTVDSCSRTCSLRNNSIAGLQYRCHCFCGESYAKYGSRHERDCSDRCTGNRSQICGGEWANSVYYVCPFGYYGSKCQRRCNCNQTSRCAFLTGECNSTCKAGWTGDSCNIRDCMAEGGGCSENETCATVSLKFATFTRCQCLPGFGRKAYWLVCQDIDECGLDICDASTTNCTNAIGSYNCLCKTGYQQLNKTTCSDVDECKSRTHACDIETELCINTIGSYACHCKLGYDNSTLNSCTGFSCSPTIGIILGTIMTISLLFNALFVVLRIKSFKSRNSESPEPSIPMEQDEFEPRCKRLSGQPKIQENETFDFVGEDNDCEHILERHQITMSPAFEYAGFKKNSYVKF